MGAPALVERPERQEQPRLFAVETGTASGARAPVEECPAPAGLRLVTGGERSLEAATAGSWAELVAGSVAACLVCDGRMEPRWSAGAGVVGGRCADCGSTLD